jgi:hypothetical protein
MNAPNSNWDEDTTPASEPTEKERIFEGEGRVLAIFFGLGLILWPFLAFGAIFMFDSPIESRSDLLSREAFAYFIWGYPITYAATCLAYYLLRRVGAGRLVSCFAWGLPVAAYFLFPVVLARRGADADPKRVQFLYRTDHAALLADCREVMAHRNTYKHRKEDYRFFINLKDPKLPPSIVALHPCDIISDSDDDVYLDLHRGSERFGVMAYSEKTANSHTNDVGGSSGQILLTPGLLFFDERLTYKNHAEYLKKLKAMKPDDAPAPQW